MNDKTQLYEAKTLMTGYKIGLKTPHLYIGVPEKNVKGGGCFAKFQDEVRGFSIDKCVGREKFNDKFRPGKKYTLCYFLWKKVSKGPVKSVVSGPDIQDTNEAVAGVKIDKSVVSHQMKLKNIDEGKIK